MPFLTSITSRTLTVAGTISPFTKLLVAGAATSVDEGNSLTFNVLTNEWLDDDVLYWTVDNLPSNFVAGNGSITIASGAASFAVTPLADYTTNGEETFTVSLRSDSISGTILDTTDTITVNDTTTPPTFATGINVNETTNRNATVTFGNVVLGETYYYEVVGDTDTTDGVSAQADANDLTTNPVGTSSSIVATDDGTGVGRVVINIYAIKDYFTDGTQEDARVNLRAYADGPVIASTRIRITDTSLTQTATVNPAATTVSQGASLTFTLNTNNFPTGYQATYRIVNGTTDSADFAFGDGFYNTETQSGIFNSAFGGNVNVSITMSGTAGIGETFQMEVLTENGDRAGISEVVTVVA